MIYLFTVSARLAAKDKFDELNITSDDVDISDYPIGAELIKVLGFRKIRDILESESSIDDKLNQVCYINIPVNVLDWEGIK